MGTTTAADTTPLRFETEPGAYVHWKLSFDGPIARLDMDVQDDEGHRSDYELKLNSYDLGVDIELADAVQRLRFEHPEVRVLVVGSAKDRIFCAGANIYMLGSSTHAFKVNFCKFTNETRLAIEDAGRGERRSAPGGAQRHLRRRRLRAGAGLRRDHPGRRRQLGGQPARDAAARRAARHRRPDAARRQAQGAPRPRRRVLHGRRGHQGQARRGVGPGRRMSSRPAASRPVIAEHAQAAAAAGAGPRGRDATQSGVALAPLGRTYEDGADRPPLRPRDAGRPSLARSRCAGPRPPRRRTPQAARAQAPTGGRCAPFRELDDALLHLRFNRPTDRPGRCCRTEGDIDAVLAARRVPGRARGTTGSSARSCATWKRTLEAPRPDRAELLRADRAGLLLRRHAARAGAGRRPHLHARRPGPSGRRSPCRP